MAKLDIIRRTEREREKDSPLSGKRKNKGNKASLAETFQLIEDGVRYEDEDKL